MPHPKKWYDDLSDWTPVMLAAKIREIETAKAEAYEEYVDTIANLNMQMERLQKAISNEGLKG